MVADLFIGGRWRMGDAQHCNAEWIVLNAVRCHSSQDVNAMKEKLLFSGLFSQLHMTTFRA